MHQEAWSSLSLVHSQQRTRLTGSLYLLLAWIHHFASPLSHFARSANQPASMDSTLFIIGVIGNIISVLVFISPIKTFWRIVKSKSTEEFEPAPYVFTLLNALLWLYYGLTKPDGFLVATVNGFGAVMEAIYVILFLVYAADHATRIVICMTITAYRYNLWSVIGSVKTAKLAAALDIGGFGAVFAVTTFAISELQLRIMVVGMICACLNVLMYGSPLAAMKTVITTKSVEFMPFFLSFFLFLNGGVWATYAVLDRDIFLGIPNGTGFVLGAIQLIIYAIYKNSKASQSSNETADPLLASNA